MTKKSGRELLIGWLEQSPFDRRRKEALMEGVRCMTDDEALRVCEDLESATAALPEALDRLEEALTEVERTQS